MNRDYANGNHSDTEKTMFVGDEVEHTPAFGKRTLFVVGVQNTDHIHNVAVGHAIDHIYLGANMSFSVTENTEQQWSPWEEMAISLLKKNYWVTLDITVDQVEGLLETGCVEYDRFIPMISVPLPYIDQLGYNACLKLDDRDFAATNPGVWVHHIHDLKKRDCYTSWDKYRSDTVIAQDTVS